MSKVKFFLDGHGCAKNQVDGEEIAARLEASGYSWVSSADEAEIIIVNSCGFIDDAKKESLDAVMAWKAAFPGKKVILAGCLAQRYAAELSEGLPEADGIAGNVDLADVVRAADKVMAGARPVIALDPESPPEEMAHRAPYRRGRLLDFPGTAHVKITEGCSNRCTYCAIPLIRGPLRSRPVPEIVAECAELVGRGVREIVLIGQDLGAFGRDLEDRPLLPELFRALCELDGTFRVRTLYIHPDNFPREILPLMAVRPDRLLPYFDIPFQHASAPLLKAMNRRGSAGIYLKLVSDIRSAFAEAGGDCVIRSTFLVGFPGESEEDFAALLAFQEEASLDWLGAFTYSREEGTPAHDMKARVPKKVAEKRKKLVEDAQERITPKRLTRFIGAELEVLVEEKVASGNSKEHADGDASGDANMDGGEPLSLGRAWLQAPEVDGLVVLRGEAEPGSLVRARVLAVSGVDLDAIPVRGGKVDGLDAIPARGGKLDGAPPPDARKTKHN
jgi:ribosomal protein S12 methylthiotransferase